MRNEGGSLRLSLLSNQHQLLIVDYSIAASLTLLIPCGELQCMSHDSCKKWNHFKYTGRVHFHLITRLRFMLWYLFHHFLSLPITMDSIVLRQLLWTFLLQGSPVPTMWPCAKSSTCRMSKVMRIFRHFLGLRFANE